VHWKRLPTEENYRLIPYISSGSAIGRDRPDVRAGSRGPPCRAWYGYDPADQSSDHVSRLSGAIRSDR
jgi:hypothetical protein